ncbi:unnamed protein product [Tilletia controversa]|nr:unnamed protein product [Tilletia controversa]
MSTKRGLDEVEAEPPTKRAKTTQGNEDRLGTGDGPEKEQDADTVADAAVGMDVSGTSVAEGIVILYEFGSVAPVEPEFIVDEVLACIAPLQRGDKAKSAVRSTPGSVIASLFRSLEDGVKEGHTLQLKAVLANLHVFSLQRQARVDTEYGG